MRLKTTKGRTKRQPWWAIVRSRGVRSKTYHTLNVAYGKDDKAVVVTTRALDLDRPGAFASCLPCRSTSCAHAIFVAECVTMGVTSIGEERHRDSLPPATEPPADLEHFHGTSDDEGD